MQKMKQFYLDSVKSLKKTQNLTFCGLMAALGIVLNFVASIDLGPYIRIGFSGIPNRMVDFLFGPVVGCFFAGMMDILKFMVKPSGTFFFGFTFNAMLAGLIYGYFLYNKPVKLWRVFIPELICKIVINCGLNTLWISMLYGKAFFAILPARIIKNIIMLPIDTLILFFACTLMYKLKNQFKIAE